MKNNNKNNKIYVILLIFGLTSLFLIIFSIYPLLKGIKKSSEDLIFAKNGIVALGAQTNETRNFSKDYETYKPNFEKIDQLFVDSSNPADFFKFLEDTASNSKITSQISLPPYSQTSQQFIIFQFYSKGNFSEILDFSKKIETGPYLLEIENLTIQNSGVSAGGPSNTYKDYSSRKVEATFTIKAFIKPG